jgi:hypothetical protein
MKLHRTGCLICGKDIKYFESAISLQCSLCGETQNTTAACEDNHFVCDNCHSQKGIDYIANFALETNSKNPLQIAKSMMEYPLVNMHGPEHHFLVPAALLAAYKNSGGDIDLTKSLTAAKQRASKVPGGTCGMWGCCGAGVGSGIFISVITKATPLSVNEWKLANLMTSKSLAEISKNGGPRCCKRNTNIAISSAVEFVMENFGIKMERPPREFYCTFHQNNSTCRKNDCHYFPNK